MLATPNAIKRDFHICKLSPQHQKLTTIYMIYENVFLLVNIIYFNTHNYLYSYLIVYLMRLITISIISLLVLVGCTEQKQDENQPFVMSMKQLSEEIRETQDNITRTYYTLFKTLEPGDELVLKDTIAEKQYYEDNATLLLFSSKPGGGLYFQGDLIDFMVNDSVEITLHISRDVFQKTVGDTKWTFDIEIFSEGWDFQTHNPMALPTNTIKKI